MFSWLAANSNGSGSAERRPEIYETVVSGLQGIYRKTLLPLEKDFKFAHFHHPLMTDGDFAASPLVLLVGQYSTGKTSFIRHLLEREYPGIRVGPEPTTDRFVAVVKGVSEMTLPGHAAVVDTTLPWSALSDFGGGFLSRFEVATLKSPVLDGLSIVDTPGVLSGSKQLDRGYNFDEAIRWFSERADLILLMFDAHKLDISDELRNVIHALKGRDSHGNDSKLRILLNKCDSVSPQQLMRVYGALMWSLGKTITTPEVPRVYIGSFWDQPLKMAEYRSLFEAEANDLYLDIAQLPATAAVRKLDDFVRRVRVLRVHCLLISHIRRQLPLFGKAAKQKDLVKNLPIIYKHLAQERGLPAGDFPPVSMMQAKFSDIDVSRFPKLEGKRLSLLDDVLSRQIPQLMGLLPVEQAQACEKGPRGGTMVDTSPSPFMSGPPGSVNSSLPPWVVERYLNSPPEASVYDEEFQELQPDMFGRLTGEQAKTTMNSSQLPNGVLHRIWSLADVNKDGYLNLFEFALAKHFISMKLDGWELPTTLPSALCEAAREFAVENSYQTPNSGGFSYRTRITSDHPMIPPSTYSTITPSLDKDTLERFMSDVPNRVDDGSDSLMPPTPRDLMNKKSLKQK